MSKFLYKNSHITIDSKRKAYWLYHYINRSSHISRMNPEIKSEERAKEVLNHLSALATNGKEIEIYVNEMIQIFENQTLPDEELKWVDKSNRRLVYWIWAYLRLNFQLRSWHIQNAMSIEAKQAQATCLPNTNNGFSFNRNAMTNEERYEAIIYCLDETKASKEQKRSFLIGLKLKWLQLVKSVPKLSWLKQNSYENLNYSLKYMKNIQNKLRLQNQVTLNLELIQSYEEPELLTALQGIFDIFHTQNLMCIYFNPTQTAEMNLEFQAKLQIGKMRKAFDERNRRSRLKKEKMAKANLRLSNKAQLLLNTLAASKGEKPMQALEKILESSLPPSISESLKSRFSI